MLREELSDEIKSRQTKYGNEFTARFKKTCLQRLSPALQNTTMFMGNAHMFIKPKLIDGSPNPLWPEGVDTPPRDEKERKEFFDKLREAHLADWLKRMKEGEFDRAPEIHADPDPDVEQRLTADDLEDSPETEVVGAEELEEEIKLAETVNEYDDGESTEEAEEAEEEIAEQKIAEQKVDKSKLRLNSDYAKEQYAATGHGNTMIGMLKCFIMDVIRHEVDTTAKESPKTSDDIMKLIDENIALKNAMLKLGKEVAELKSRADVAKKIIVTHNEQIKSLQQPKDGGVEGL